MRDKSIQLVVDIEPELPQIEADPVRLRQVLTNLAANAREATQTVVDPCLRVAVAQETDTVMIRLEDNGPGIPADQRERVFVIVELEAGVEQNHLV